MRLFETPDGSSSPPSDDVPVLIIGGGPCGLLQAHLLSQLSVRCLVIERYEQRLAAPKAHALSPRSLEICRQFSLDVKYIRSRGTSRDDAFWVNFVTSLDGQHVGRLPYERMDVSVLDDTPEMIHNIPQPDFEQIVSDQLSKSRLTEIRKNHSFVNCHNSADGTVYTTVEDRATGETYTVRSRYLIAADGARSYVKKYLGIRSTGEDSTQTMMTIHFHADLRPICGSKVGILHWIMDPLVSGFIIGYDLSGNQVLICNFDSKTAPIESWNEAKCLNILHAAIGKNTPIKVQSWRPWIFKRTIAEHYRMGNVFLVGDAAHSFPPTGGLGLNSGLADTHNLAYKLAFVLRGWANDSILDTYEQDRRHVAEINSIQSVKNGHKIFGLLKALGTATTSDHNLARQNLFKSLASVEKRRRIDREIEEQQEHFDNLELHIGYVYGSPTFPPHASHYTPKYTPGARLPHAWIEILNPTSSASAAVLPPNIVPIDLSYVSELSTSDIHIRRFSTLDLCRPDSFLLIQANTAGAEARAVEVRRRLVEQQNQSEKLLDCRTNAAAIAETPLLSTVTYGLDFRTLPDNVAGTAFARQANLLLEQSSSGGDGGGGILVRPDQHILMVLDADTTAEEVVGAMRVHLGW